MESMTRTAAIYTRISTSSQDDNTSIDRQLQAGQDWIRRQGWTEVIHISDTQTGKSYETRKGIQQLLQMLEAGTITDVVCYSVDRAGREVVVIRRLFTEIYASGGRVSIVSKGKTYNSFPEIKKDTFWDSTIAEFERMTIETRMTDGRLYAFNHLGAHIGSYVYGYEKAKGKVEANGRSTTISKSVPDKIEAANLVKILKYYVQSKSIARTVEYAYSIGAKTIKGKSPATGMITQMIDSADKYAGRPQEEKLGTATRQMSYPALISEELADAVKLIRATTPKRQKLKSLPQPYYHLIRCACCGSYSHIDKGYNLDRKGDFFYICSSRKRDLNRADRGEYVMTSPCKYMIALKHIDKALARFLDVINTDTIESQFEYEVAKQIGLIKQIDDKKAGLSLRRDTLKTQQDNMINATTKLIAEGGFTEVLTAMSEKLVEIRRELVDIEVRFTEIKKEIDLKTRVFASFGLDISKIDEYVMPKMLDVFRLDSVVNGDLNKDLSAFVDKRPERVEKHNIVQLHSSFIQTQSANIRAALKKLSSDLTNKEYEDVTIAMTKLGLRIEVDYSEADKVQRARDIRVKVDFAPLEQLLGLPANVEVWKGR